MTQGDIHNRNGTLERLKTKVRESPDISDREKDLLLRGTSAAPSFLSHMQQKDHSTSRVSRYLRTALRFAEYNEWEIENVTKVRITSYIGDLNQDVICKKNGEPFAAATKSEIKKGIRKLYVDYIESYSSELNVEDDFDGEDYINFSITAEKNFTEPDRLPTPHTVKRLVESANRIRDQAYIMLLWSTGGRHGEILGLKWRDVSFTNSVGKVTFRDTKTGGNHSVPMGEAYPFMLRHQENDPRSNEPDTYVFRSTQFDEQFSSSGAANMIKRARKNVEDIPGKTKTNPHAFRKGRASYWARQDKSEAWICKHMNWTQGSDIVRHYCRLAQENVEQGVAEHLGLKHENREEKEESRILTPSECHSCGTVNTFRQDVCQSCGEALRSGELFEESQIKDKTDSFMEEIVRSNTPWEPEEVNEKAKEFVKEEFDLA